MRRSLILIFLSLLLAACATNISPPSPPERSDREPRSSDTTLPVEQGFRVERSGNTVIYRGRLTETGLDTLRDTGGEPEVTTLLIESTGGEIVVGMDFGTWVIDRKLDVVIDRACLSSCANYIFTAGRRKEILPGAVVAWHGSAKQPGLLEQLHELVEEDIASQGLPPRKQQRELARARRANIKYLTRAIYKQDEFFFRVGVDEYVTRIGNDKYGVRGFFYLSVADMAAFGIENVTAAQDYAAMEPRALAERIGYPVTLVKLE